MASSPSPQWLTQVLNANASRALDDSADRKALEQALVAGLAHEEDRVVELIAQWVEQHGPRWRTLAQAIRDRQWRG